MKPQTIFAALLLMLHFSVAAQPVIQAVETRQSQIERNTDQALAQQWGLRDDEWTRYRELMQGPLGIYSPNLDPLSALGIEAQSDAERRRYAELQVQAEARRVEKLLAYQRAYDEAWQRLYPGMQRVNLPDAFPVSHRAMAAPQFLYATIARRASKPCSVCKRRAWRLTCIWSAVVPMMPVSAIGRSGRRLTR